MEVTSPTADPFSLRGVSAALRLRPGEALTFPNRLDEPEPDRQPLPAAWRLLAALTAAALVPRLLMAWRLPTICVDGAAYIEAAQAIEGGGGFFGVNFGCNLYAPILAGLHRLGLSWDSAGAVWGVLCATLVVPPLFGWVRRQFDDRVAVVACLMYAAHAELIEWTPETIRDQTYWLLFALTLYGSWRAVVEVNLRYFLLVGFLLPASILTRFEGAFLLIPLGGWAWVRSRSLNRGRMKLLCGLILAVGIAPTLLVTMNALWIKQESVTRLLYVEPWNRVRALVAYVTSPASTEPAVEAAAKAASSRAKLDPVTVVWRSLRIVEHGFGPVFGLLLLGGFAAYWRLFLRSDHLPIALLGLTTFVGIAIHYWYCGAASSRYALPIVIMSLRCAAVACMRFCDAVATRSATSRRAVLFAPACVLLLTIGGWADALSTGYGSRVEKAELGQWIRQRYGEQCLLMGADSQLPLIGYYAQARTTWLPQNLTGEALLATLDQSRPDVVFVSQPPLSDEACLSLRRDCVKLGMQELFLPKQVSKRYETLVLERTPTRR